LLDHEPPADTVVGTYVELVVAQRAVAPSTREDLRDWELAELAGLLNLPPAELDALIDRELDRLLGRVHDNDDAPNERRRRRVIAATAFALAVGVSAAAVAAATTGSDAPENEPTVETIILPDGSTATRTESAPAPPSEGVDIGTAVEIERSTP
jgi:hypothetical protein